jgi:hypothetical protein
LVGDRVALMLAVPPFQEMITWKKETPVKMLELISRAYADAFASVPRKV